MATRIVAGHEVEVDAEGFFRRPEQWTEEMAGYLAKEAGIDELTDAHWTVIRLVRAEYAEKGSGPAVRALSKESGIGIKELYALFPKGPAKLASQIAGVPKPRGCI